MAPYFLTLTIFCFFAGASFADVIQPALFSLLEKEERANVLISFKDGIRPALEKAKSLRNSRGDRGARNTAIINILEEHADASQAGVMQTLSARSALKQDQGFKYFKQYKSANLIFVKEATADLLKVIATDSNVFKIEKEPGAKLVKLVDNDDQKEELVHKIGLDKPGINLHQMQVPEAWELLGDLKRDHVRVGFIDTGVRYTHEVLRENFVGLKYGWYDPVDNKPEPYEADDATGHGTKMTGLGVASHNIGVAPGVKWMACMGCTLEDCAAEWLLDCIQFMECPTLPDGSNRDCSKAPHVVNNSWESIRGENGYAEFILKWRELGIIPVFAVGNQGPQCETTAAPGEYSFVIGVGGFNWDATVYAGARGPAPDGTLKPDVIAPCHGRTTNRFSDQDTRYVDGGTSPATSHVTGLVALLMVRQPDITYEEVYSLITSTAETTNVTVKRYQYTCKDDEFVIPNNHFGYGRVNAYKALQAQTAMLLEKGKKV